MAVDIEQISIDYMLLADGAHSVGGKLYVLGGGWDRLYVPTLPGTPLVPFALAVGIEVPWNQTNRRFACTLQVTDADNTEIAPALQADIEQGRPPGLRAGTPQRAVLAATFNPTFPGEGRYVIHGSIDGERQRSVAFEVHQAPPASQPQAG